ncbi:hypothetical protein N7457_008040 [Penicillium paradoxum]|uniref:uncharacterized protein n=1 Tax=Penicillium paradoxum TaxID=176176 RepID=UPI0025492664|nr:uncharacterized protein N7457_008040 [Penicillium paradoxum]KAJ5773144.1 hypothetical protein N7457_008040 [Penicillium paradoxum]
MASHHNGRMPEKAEQATPGSVCEAHKLYQTPPDERGYSSWTHEWQRGLVAPSENSLSSKYALLVRKIKCYDGRKSLEIHSIIVQSAPLKKFLVGVMAGYPGLTLTLNRIEFSKPFKPFVHRWTQFSEALADEQDPTTSNHAKLLYDILDEELKDTISRKNDLIKSNVVTHDLLWAIFEPDCLVFCEVLDGVQRVFQFKSADIDSKGNFEIESKYVDWDGEYFGYSSQCLYILAYEGTSPIMGLPVIPLAYHTDQKRLREELTARGKLWESYQGYHYKYYDGPAKAYLPLMNREIKLNIQGRIIIDTEAYKTFAPECDFSVSDEITQGLSDDQRLMATPVLRGYALKEKQWMEIFVDNVKEIVWDTKAFDSLVLPHAQQDLKRLILGFARAQSSRRDTFDDVIQGKGRGVIMLLKGPPGVGKTLTAESVAEVMKVPLYILSAADLGITASAVEDKLRNIMTMIPRWGAIILLDEADVFMEARNTVDLQRNELVSIFLRLLEYYEGILFLTTNRAEIIDPAFESRIHLSIRYPELTPAARRQIWSQFMANREIKPFSEDELDYVSNLELNGRQIKNVLKTAHLLAQEEECGLNYEHVRIVLALRDFEKAEDAAA